MKSVVTLTLPMPPSANKLFRNVTAKQRAAAASRGSKLPGRLKTGDYNAWIEHAGYSLNLQRPGHLAGPYALVIFIPPARPDADNLIKATSDLLVKHNVIEDDSLAHQVAIERVVTMTGEDIQVHVQSWADAPRFADVFDLAREAGLGAI